MASRCLEAFEGGLKERKMIRKYGEGDGGGGGGRESSLNKDSKLQGRAK